MELVRYLIKDATSNPLKRITRREDKNPIEEEEAECSKKYKVSGNFKLPLNRLTGQHFPEYRTKRSACLWCRYMRKKNNLPYLQNPPQSNIYCSECGVALCCNNQRSSCFKDFHTIE
ncbi:piggybac transposable element-derived protein 4-like [Gigaspora margarita]|uniref:Piggybac transposable element-derived protein 4-like n=1 Tax=Gigaspora margarita TaxID=4874 RepID=A0A8H3WZV1_GIGMA|nr:piggybac transposable element-derived protein 4-like [Gigaspora margarita]